MDAAFRRAVAQVREDGELFFESLLGQQIINEAFHAASVVWRSSIYTPAVTIWVFLTQCLSPDHSCREAVSKLIAARVAQGKRPCSAKTGAYCQRRDALPEGVCQNLARQAGQDVDENAPAEWLWHGRRVRDVDGSTSTMPDTPENQAAYPQSTRQKHGCGFPIARIVVLFSLATGAVLEMVIGPCKGKRTGENSLFRTMHHMLCQGDVILADRYFSGWFDLALLIERGVDVVVRKHQRRFTDFRKGRRLGRGDHVAQWPKPKQKPEWLDKDTYDAMQDILMLREVRVEVDKPGFRTRKLIVVTTLLDAREFKASEIAKLYRRRWDAELNLRSLKIVLQMDYLRCKTPHRVRNEFYMHILAYNLIRKLTAVAAARDGREPWTISFKGTQQTLNNLLPVLSSSQTADAWCDALFDAIATHTVGDRPDRFEPRVKKRRPTNYPYMNKPRDDYKRLAA